MRGGMWMHTKLSIPERLKDLRVVDKHLTLEQLAEQTGLSKSALSKYESDDYKDISPFAIATLAEFYGVSTDYLMGLSENKNHPNTELQALHLSDDMVTLLSSGKINNRLLCEIATHENFQRLMTDIEIFVDRIADMRIAQMNLVLEATRQEVIRSHAQGITTFMSARWSWDRYRKVTFLATRSMMIWTVSFRIFVRPMPPIVPPLIRSRLSQRSRKSLTVPCSWAVMRSG